MKTRDEFIAVRAPKELHEQLAWVRALEREAGRNDSLSHVVRALLFNAIREYREIRILPQARV